MEIPFTKTYTLVSKLPQQEIISRLNDVIENPQQRDLEIEVNVMGLKNKTVTKPFRGAVREDRFMAVREILFENTFMPVINGAVESEEKSSKVIMKMGMTKYAFFFLALFNGLLILLLIMGLLGKLQNDNGYDSLAITISLAVFNTLIFGIYYFEISKARKFFALLLAAEIS